MRILFFSASFLLQSWKNFALVKKKIKIQPKRKPGTFPSRKCETSRKIVGEKLGRSYAGTLPTVLSLKEKYLKHFQG